MTDKTNKTKKSCAKAGRNLCELGLTETFDRVMDEEMVAEGLAKALAIGSLLFIPAFASAKDIQDALPKGQTEYTKADIKQAMEKAYVLDASYGGMLASNVCNIIARTLWAEARGEGREGLEAILSVILNRCGGDANKTVSVIKKPQAFTCWKEYTGGWTDSSYQFFEPSAIKTSKRHEAIWRMCNELASKYLAGQFESTIGNYNSYMNKETAGKKSLDAWGDKCDLKIGKHHFGYLPENDGYRTERLKKEKARAKADAKAKAAKAAGTTTTLKKGDSLWKIARRNGLTVDDLLKKNPSIGDAGKVKVGQKINL